MKKSEIINEGGINGSGEGLVNQNSESFRALQQMIIQQHQAKTEEEKRSNKILSLRFQMESYLSPNMKGPVTPAGNFIERLLQAAGVSKKRFADYIDYDYSNLIATLKGRRRVNPDFAIKTGQIFGIDPTLWLQIDSKNELLEYLASNRSSGKFSLEELVG